MSQWVEYDIAYGDSGPCDDGWTRNRASVERDLEWVLRKVQEGDPQFPVEDYPQPIRIVRRTVTRTVSQWEEDE